MNLRPIGAEALSLKMTVFNIDMLATCNGRTVKIKSLWVVMFVSAYFRLIAHQPLRYRIDLPQCQLLCLERRQRQIKTYWMENC